jgi:hypothetical protein
VIKYAGIIGSDKMDKAYNTLDSVLKLLIECLEDDKDYIYSNDLDEYIHEFMDSVIIYYTDQINIIADAMKHDYFSVPMINDIVEKSDTITEMAYYFLDEYIQSKREEFGLLGKDEEE